ncbi:SOS response-associated peptidase family protein [Roseateles terrae]|uniref:Abasic site processing protein n=1 Tax=Roseateles terrae TaxID=431060 RepID=A0ABR6GNN4_9BURK|nr:SOS response-associated peptidase family protein [Roseateles terrae]MBB3192854.1 putative SOS response-associated peptidase YedK [Roseateles terrae]
MTPKNDLEVYVRRHLARLWLPEYDPPKPFVGPFDTGLFLRAATPGVRSQKADAGRGERLDGQDETPADSAQEATNAALEGVFGQWGLIRPGSPARKDMMQPRGVPGRKPPAPRARTTNNARIETVTTTPTFRAAWNEGRRCLIPASWYQEPNWETGKNIWWQLRRADGDPWMLAGIWNEWVDPATGEVVPNYSMLTCNCDGHPLLGRLHKPDPSLPPDAQDKRAVIAIEPQDWASWLFGSMSEAQALLRPAAVGVFDPADAIATDQALSQPGQP